MLVQEFIIYKYFLATSWPYNGIADLGSSFNDDRWYWWMVAQMNEAEGL